MVELDRILGFFCNDLSNMQEEGGGEGKKCLLSVRYFRYLRTWILINVWWVVFLFSFSRCPFLLLWIWFRRLLLWAKRLTSFFLTIEYIDLSADGWTIIHLTTALWGGIWIISKFLPSHLGLAQWVFFPLYFCTPAQIFLVDQFLGVELICERAWLLFEMYCLIGATNLPSQKEM